MLRTRLKWNSIAITQLLLLIAIGLLSVFAAVFFGERIPLNNGAGWDGVHYVDLSSNFFETIFEVNDNTLKRFLPCLLIYTFIEIIGVEHSHLNVVNVFAIYNFIILIASFFVWRKLVVLFSFSTLADWIGFVSLFISFAVIKFPFYYSPSVDLTGYFLSLLLLLYYKSGNLKGLYLTGLFGAMAWPPIIYMLFPLIVFSNSRSISLVLDRNRKKLNSIIIIFISIAFVSLGAYCIYLVPDARGFCSGPLTYIIKELYPVSLVATFAFVLGGLHLLIGKFDFINVFKHLKSVNFKQLFYFLAFFVAITAAYKLFGFHFQLKGDESIKSFLWNVLVTSNRQPLCFAVSHVLYFGPVIILLLLNFRSVVSIVMGSGLGMLIIFLLSFLFFFDAESRHMISFVPFLSLYTIEAVKNRLSKIRVLIFVIIAVLFSKTWFSLNHFPFSNWKENYFMNFGHFYTDKVYIFSFAIVLLASIVLFLVFRKTPKIKDC